MLFTFKKIRQKLTAENLQGSFSKYLLYALGEILLVVIGILLALQVNIWNQNRQKRDLEKSILLEIQKNLEEDLYEIGTDISGYQTVIDADSAIIRHFRSGLPFHDSIGALIHVAQMSPHVMALRSGYTLLESKGIGIVSDDSLRVLITDLYEWSYPYYDTYAGERFHAIEFIIQPYWAKHFFIEEHHEFPERKRVPIDYEFLSKDAEFLSLIQTSLFQAQLMKRKSEDLIAAIQTVKKHIRKYLQSDFGIERQ